MHSAPVLASRGSVVSQYHGCDKDTWDRIVLPRSVCTVLALQYPYMGLGARPSACGAGSVGLPNVHMCTSIANRVQRQWGCNGGARINDLRCAGASLEA
jgi:hypothetical protein